MLNEAGRNKAKSLLEIIVQSKKDGKFPQLTAYDIEWLAVTLLEINKELEAASTKTRILTNKIEEKTKFYQEELAVGHTAYKKLYQELEMVTKERDALQKQYVEGA